MVATKVARGGRCCDEGRLEFEFRPVALTGSDLKFAFQTNGAKTEKWDHDDGHG